MGRSLKDMNLDDMDLLWEEAKKNLRPKNKEAGNSEVE